ncbi:MAG: hypothetical protein ACE5DN_04335 [Flavobacteriales bacterium]
MKKKSFHCFWPGMVLLLSATANAQDTHFSQFFLTPLIVRRQKAKDLMLIVYRIFSNSNDF